MRGKAELLLHRSLEMEHLSESDIPRTISNKTEMADALGPARARAAADERLRLAEPPPPATTVAELGRAANGALLVRDRRALAHPFFALPSLEAVDLLAAVPGGDGEALSLAAVARHQPRVLSRATNDSSSSDDDESEGEMDTDVWQVRNSAAHSAGGGLGRPRIDSRANCKEAAAYAARLLRDRGYVVLRGDAAAVLKWLELAAGEPPSRQLWRRLGLAMERGEPSTEDVASQDAKAAQDECSMDDENDDDENDDERLRDAQTLQQEMHDRFDFGEITTPTDHNHNERDPTTAPPQSTPRVCRRFDALIFH